MTVQELIELLQKEDPKKRVVVSHFPEYARFPGYKAISGVETERIMSPFDQDFDEYVVTLY